MLLSGPRSVVSAKIASSMVILRRSAAKGGVSSSVRVDDHAQGG
jgi:hypothetical protein